MADDLSIFSVFDFQDVHKPLEGLLHDILVTQQVQVSNFGNDIPEGVDPSTTDIRNSGHPSEEKWIDDNLENNSNVSAIPQPDQLILEGQNLELSLEESDFIHLQPKKICTESFRVLGNYGKRKERFKEGIFSGQSSKSTATDNKLTTEEIMRMAAERFIHFSNKELDGITSFIHPHGTDLSSLSSEDTRMVDLAHLLLASAEKVGNKQFDAAHKLLVRCEGKVSESGHPAERITYHFSKALRARITMGIGSSVGMIETDQGRDYSGLSSGIDLTHLVLHKEVPFSKVMQFASIQTILENVAAAKKIHLIDLQLRNGIQWTPLLQALSERQTIPVQLLRITALQTTDEDKAETVGKRLHSYAKSLNISFVFKVVIILNMKDLKVELFKIRPGEAVAVYSPIVLRAMIPKPENLQILLRVIQKLGPKIMVVNEVEANHNSPSFVNRFTEALFYFSAWFDALEDCLNRDDVYRMDAERTYFGQGILNIVATEGEDRITRSVNIDVWRVFFQSLRMVEIDISKSSLDQANFVLEQKFSCGKSCTIYKNGKCLIVGWKGTPLHSVSAWKFK
ncbi:Transcription factor GRAS1 [Heracleum sosnowskyi]|uniref:Transcription factor GRAS1 n=1 Tax=Heracleum sosnowskyi TaxID=360622 RepID=A0AAD8LXQ3_9APIA|nr:Transcription factor GRAS1 [Heracleum sosnowskyi]